MMLYFLELFLIVTYARGGHSGCPLSLSLDITKGTDLGDGTIVSKEGISFTPGSYFHHNGHLRGCPCKIKNCIRKCCPKGQAVINGTCRSNSNPFHFDVYNEMDKIEMDLNDFYFIYNRKCDYGFYLLSPSDYIEDAFYVQSDGKLYMEEAEAGRVFLEPQQYCLDTFLDNGDDTQEGLSALVCLPKPIEIIVSYGMIISMPFLLVTFFVYAILPDRNLHGKALMCYVISLFWAYVLLVYIQLNPQALELTSCQVVGILCLFFFMVSFFWMNVMSIDIWWAFSGLRGFSGSKKEAERKRFLLYSIYACGIPLLLVILVVSLNVSTSIPTYAWYNPGIGYGQCWFREGYPTLLYFYGPMAALILANIILFGVTAWKIKQVQQDTAVLRKDESKKHSYENDKQRFNLYLKLLLAMGVNWSMEVISWAVDWQVGTVPPAVWYITDFCNALYGVFIFFIFVFKRNIWKLLKRRYYMVMGKPHLARSMTQTAYSPRTTGSCLSQTDKTFVNDSSVLTSEVA